MASADKGSTFPARRAWWLGTGPTWFDRLAHYLLLWLVAGILYALFAGRSYGRTFEDRVAVPAVVGATVYAVGFIVSRIQLWQRRSHGPQSNDA